VRRRRRLHSNVCRLDKLHRLRKMREGGSNAKPSLGKNSTPSHGPPIISRWSMPIKVRDGLLSNFSQLRIWSVLKLGGIPPSGNVSIFGQRDIVSSCNFGRRVFNWHGNPSLLNDTNFGQSTIAIIKRFWRIFETERYSMFLQFWM
jgi:hypothetical protein